MTAGSAQKRTATTRVNGHGPRGKADTSAGGSEALCNESEISKEKLSKWFFYTPKGPTNRLN